MTMRLAVPEYIYCYKDKDHPPNDSRSLFDCDGQDEQGRHLSSQVSADSNRENNNNSRKRNYRAFTSENKKYHHNENWQNRFHRGESRCHEFGPEWFPHPQNYSHPFIRRWDLFENQCGERDRYQREYDDVPPPCRRDGYYNKSRNSRRYNKKSCCGKNQQTQHIYTYHHNRSNHCQRRKVNHSFGYRPEYHPSNSHRRNASVPNRGCVGGIPSNTQTPGKGHRKNHCKWNGRGYPPSHFRPF